MREFMNELYQNGEGKAVTGVYRGVPFMGKISLVRSTYGGGINVYVDLDEPVVISGHERNALVLDGEELHNGAGPVAHNLHVYL